MSKTVENNKDGGITPPEPEPSKPKSFKTFLYDPNTGAVLGRTGINWFKIIVFYIIFYFFLAAFFALAMWLFMLTIKEDGPKYYLDDSVIGTSPGLGFRPMSKVSEESSLIWYTASSDSSRKNWTMGLEEFLEEYKNQTQELNVVRCDYGNKTGYDEVCSVNIDEWAPCTSSENFGYPDSKPCIFIKLNKILKWEPDYFKSVKELPKEMPEDLKKHIEGMQNKGLKFLNTVWLSCEGENPADKEFIGTVEYIPHRGFPGYYYPFLGVKNYLSPLVAVHFKNITRNVLVNIECKAWAHNVKHDRRDRIGLVHFELLVD